VTAAVVIRGDAAHLPLPDASVDLLITSPPYFGLRSYTDGGEHYDGQIGSEATPREYIAALLDCTREWVRVLKPSGSMFINLGDRYDARPGSGPNSTTTAYGHSGPGRNVAAIGHGNPKSLMGLPWRYALGCIDDLGLILRAEIIWAKPNGLPESVTDRVRRSHEQVFHFTRQPRYYSAVDEVREAHTTPPVRRHTPHPQRRYTPDRLERGAAGGGFSGITRTEPQHDGNPLGKLPGSVWEIPSQPLTVPAHLGVDHFAAFPMELPRRIILGWSPPGVCTACGEGRRPVTERTAASVRHERGTSWNAGSIGLKGRVEAPHLRGTDVTSTITGYACACPDATAPARPAVVLDPFSGTGTTALVASAYGRIGIGVDRSADYCRLAKWRTSGPAELAKALRVDKPPAQADGQEALFGRQEALWA